MTDALHDQVVFWDFFRFMIDLSKFVKITFM